MELNPKVKIIVAIAIILFLLSGIPVKMIKDSFNPPVAINNTTHEVITVYKTIEILVTPTIDGKEYFASEYENGIRKIQRPFSFFRENATGYKDLSIHAVIYDYKVFNSYHWFNPTTYKYQEETPSKENVKFVFVFANIYSDDIIGDDSRFWIPTEGMFVLETLEGMYYPVKFEKQIRIKELEDSFNYNDNSMVTAYNSQREYSRSKEHLNTAGETFSTIDVLKGGESNAIDGYLLFEIPENELWRMQLWENFYAFGNAGWKLT
jgi:hypothetical protein